MKNLCLSCEVICKVKKRNDNVIVCSRYKKKRG
jgi:hypothetical protein